MPTLDTTTSIKQKLAEKTNYTFVMMIINFIAIITQVLFTIGSGIERVHWAIPCAFLLVVVFLTVHTTNSVRDIKDLTDKLAKKVG